MEAPENEQFSVQIIERTKFYWTEIVCTQKKKKKQTRRRRSNDADGETVMGRSAGVKCDSVDGAQVELDGYNLSHPIN